MRWFVWFMPVAGLLLSLTACGNAESPIQKTNVERSLMNRKLQIKLDGRTWSAVLYDSAAARDFVSQLPLTLTLADYNATEKIADLPKKLSTEGAPDGFTPVAGDLAYYAPWGNLAVFYRDFRYSSQLILLGKLEQSAVAALKGKEKCDVTFQLAEP